MKRASLSALAVVILALAGCSSTPEGSKEPSPEASTETPTPTPSASANREGCLEAGEASHTLVEALATEDKWLDLRARFDDAALATSGTVHDRILKLVDEWPDLVDIVITDDVSDFNEAMGDIWRACNAEGGDEIEFAMFSED